MPLAKTSLTQALNLKTTPKVMQMAMSQPVRPPMAIGLKLRITPQKSANKIGLAGQTLSMIRIKGHC